MTPAKLRKRIEKILKDLTPEQKADYISGELWRLCALAGKGQEISAEVTDVEKYQRDYVLTMSARDYIAYKETQWRLDTTELTRRHMEDLLAGYSREEYLLEMIIEFLEMDRRRVSDLPVIPVEVKMTDLQPVDRMIELFREYQESVRGEMKAILGARFWDSCGIPRPRQDGCTSSQETQVMDEEYGP